MGGYAYWCLNEAVWFTAAAPSPVVVRENGRLVVQCQGCGGPVLTDASLMFLVGRARENISDFTRTPRQTMDAVAMTRPEDPTIRAHEFVGRHDRWCETCDRPDRNPIHETDGEHIHHRGEGIQSEQFHHSHGGGLIKHRHIVDGGDWEYDRPPLPDWQIT